MKDTIVGGLQKFSKAMISSVLYLPAIGMVMVVCNIFTNANITNALPLLQQDWLYLPFKVIYDALLSIFGKSGSHICHRDCVWIGKEKEGTCSFGCLYVTVRISGVTAVIFKADRAVWRKPPAEPQDRL